jgi:hypothetical protein
LLGELDEALEDGLLPLVLAVVPVRVSYLDRADVGVLGGVLVLVQAILCELALAEVDAELDEEDHDGLQRDDRAVAGALRGDMLVEELQGGLLLLDSDEFLGAFASTC